MFVGVKKKKKKLQGRQDVNLGNFLKEENGE